MTAHGKSLELKKLGVVPQLFYPSQGNRKTRKEPPAGTLPLPEDLTRWDARVSRARRRRPAEPRRTATNTPYRKPL